MGIQRQRIEIHSGLDGEVFVDTERSIGELVIAGKSYGFEWTSSGLVWEREPLYRSKITEVATFVEAIFH